MILATGKEIKLIDETAASYLGISTYELIGRAGDAVARVVREHLPKNKKIIILAGKGNNGADGYAAAKLLCKDYEVMVYDIFSTGQKGNDGKRYAAEFTELGGVIKPFNNLDELRSDVAVSDCVIDAIFGTGIAGDIPSFLTSVTEILRTETHTKKIAIDIPLGVFSDDGSVDEDFVYTADITVSLCLMKPAHVSYPAKQYAGKIVFDNIGLQNDTILEKKSFKNYLVDRECASLLLPKRSQNSNKGTFGRLMMITGSSEYAGAGMLSLEAALRGGAGMVTYLGEKEQNAALLPHFPEVIYKTRKRFSDLEDTDILDIVDLSNRYNAVLIGSGCGRSEGLFKLVKALILSYHGHLILDADAINVLSERKNELSSLLLNGSASVIMTPHPLEFSRISGVPVTDVNSNRISIAKAFSNDNKCIIVLKGAATVITDGDVVFINSSGSSALAKAGSGDVLAGFLASLVASSDAPFTSSALAVYIHGKAADELSIELSEYGVVPSDLSKQMAREIGKIVNNN